jgi:perosamine synthetase
MSDPLAIDGGPPIRKVRLPYGRQTIDDDDVKAVVEVLRSDFLTTGPTVDAFEREFARHAGTAEAVAVCNGTAALHAAVAALGIEAGDEVIVPPMTFAASANAVVYQGGTPVFCDVEPETLLIDPSKAEAAIGPRTRAILAVDYAGQPCDYDTLREIADQHGVTLLADACHALGADYKGRSVGSLADMSTFSLHPVKPITSGEGGVITTDDAERAWAMRVFRNHGITTDFREREQRGAFFYEMTMLGYNYRLSDIHCALGLSQLPHVEEWTARRQAIAARYDAAFRGVPAVRPLSVHADRTCAYHLYMVRFLRSRLRVERSRIFAALQAEGIGVNVHYIPVHLHPFYRERFGTAEGLCPVAEAAYEELVTLPVFPTMTDDDTDDVIRAVEKVVAAYAA